MKKMKKLMLVGKTSCGKTSLIQRLKDEDLVYRKTQMMIYDNQFLDSPGEYIENKRMLNSLLVSSVDYDIIAFVQQADDITTLFPPGFSLMFNREIIGIITKTDLENSQEKIVSSLLQLAGARKQFRCSAVTLEGVKEIKEYLLD